MMLIFLIVSLFDFLTWNNVTITNTNTIPSWSSPTELVLNIQTRIPKRCSVKMERVSKEYCRRGAGRGSVRQQSLQLSMRNHGVILKGGRLCMMFRMIKLDHLPTHERLVYPPNMYVPPTLIIVKVGPLLSHPLWKVLAAQPSTDACQQCFHFEESLWATGLSHVLKLAKWCTLSPTITESFSPSGKSDIREE